MTCSTSNMKAVFQSVNIDFEIIFRLYVCLLLCILYNIQLKSRTNPTYQTEFHRIQPKNRYCLF